MNLIDILSKNSRLYPNETAFIEVRPVTKVRKETSWRRFEERVNKIANGLKDMGVRPGDGSSCSAEIRSIGWRSILVCCRQAPGLLPSITGLRMGTLPIVPRSVSLWVCFCDEEFAERVMMLRPSLPTIKKCLSIGEKPSKEWKTWRVPSKGSLRNPSRWS